MQEVNEPPFDLTTECSVVDLDSFSFNDRPDVECWIRYRLQCLSEFTTWYARCILNEKPTHVIVDDIMTTFYGWLKYWTSEASYLNEIKWVKLKPLKGMSPEDLTADGFRQVSENTSSIIISEISRLYFLAHYQNKDIHEWSIENTTNIWWVDDWCNLLITPEAFDKTPDDVQEYRDENDKEKRKETTDGPQNDDEKEIKETPDELFTKTINLLNYNSSNETITKPVPRRRELLWYQPVSKYSQRNLYDAVMLLIEKINDYPVDNDVITLIYCLTSRLGALLLQPSGKIVFDMPRFRHEIKDELYMCNRAFLNWASAYYYELLQRVHYYRYMYKNKIPDEALEECTEERVKALKEYVLFLCRDMGRDDFRVIYKNSCEEYFQFPGDNVYGRFLHPEGVLNRGDLLMEIRSERQGVRFFKTDHIDDGVLLTKIMHAETHLYRICVLNILDRFFHVNAGIKWRNACVVDQPGIYMSHQKLIENKMPCIAFIFSMPVLHYELKILDPNDIYKVIVLWLLYVRNVKNNMCHHVNIKRQINELLGDCEITNRLIQRNAISMDNEDDDEQQDLINNDEIINYI